VRPQAVTRRSPAARLGRGDPIVMEYAVAAIVLFVIGLVAHRS
jgi:hypothetical protein